MRHAKDDVQTSHKAEVLTAQALTEIPWLWHGFSMRMGGVTDSYGAAGELNLGFTAEDAKPGVKENRLRFVEAITGDRKTPLITLRQVHSSITVFAAAGEIAVADGIITGQSGLLVGILTADCIPVLVADRRSRVVGAFHAGWRGTVERIVELGVRKMRDETSALAGGSDVRSRYGRENRGPDEVAAEDMVAAIGPGIGACCYSVGHEVYERFTANFAYGAELFASNRGIDAASHGLWLDLVEANRRQLIDAGIQPHSISIAGGCTQCRQDRFYSHRGSGGRAGRMMAVIGIRY